MCGISGYISQNMMNDNKISDSLAHRGPDNKGQYSDCNMGYHIKLFHNRLAIVDLSDSGSQPMVDPDQNVVLVFNGEIYNYRELKKKYLSKYRFRSETDTEVMLYLYKELGINFIKLLKGDFAFGLYDKRLKKVFISRDRIGIKPLYYYYNSSVFFFSSEIKAIKKGGITLNLNKENISTYFTFKYSPLDDTLFQNVYRVPAGHYIEYDIPERRLTKKKYWELEKNIRVYNNSYHEAKNNLYLLVEKAVNEQLMGDVPIGNFLSGGTDSSAISFFIKDRNDIIHYTAKKNTDDLKKEGSSSDYYYSQLLSKQWNLNLVPVDIGSETITSQILSQINYYSDDLIADGSQIPSYLITKYAANNSKVVLSGMGADELFYGYAGHQISLLSKYLDKLPNNLSLFLAKIFAGLEPGKGMLKPYKRYLKKLGQYYSKDNTRYGFFNIVGDVENSLSIYKYNHDKVKAIFNHYFNNSNDTFDNITRFEIKNFLVKNLHYMDRMCMANSIEGRVPLLDYEIVEYAYSLPLSFKLSSFGKSKKIFKDAFSKKIPEYILKRRKAAFGMPLRSIFSNPATIYKTLDLKIFYELGNFSITDIKRIIDSHTNGLEDNSALIYSLISFQYWYKIFFDNEKINAINTNS